MLFKATFKKQSATRVLNLVHGVENLRPGMSDVISNSAISFLYKRGFNEAAFEVYTLMRAKGLIATRKTYYSILEGLINDGKDWLTLPFLNIFLKEYGLVEPKVRQILAYHMCLNDALWFLEKIKERSPAITLPISLFKTLVNKGRVLVAHQLFMEVEDSIPILDAFDYTLMVDGLCKGGYISEALDLCALAKSKGIILNIIAYNSVINRLCHQGHLVDAFRLFDSLERINLEPSEITYAILIDDLRREGFLLDAKELFEIMVLKGLKPNSHVYNSIIDGFCKIRHMEDALKLLCELDMKSHRPDEFTVSIVINGFCQKGDMEGALNFFTEFQRIGTSPDFLGFLYLIRGLCAKGRMEEVRSILREMLQSKSVLELINKVDDELETESLESVLVTLCEEGSIKDAMTVLNEIASMFFLVQRSFGCHQAHKLQKPCDNNAPKIVASTAVTSINADLEIQCSGVKKVEVGKSPDVLRRTQFHDFDYYYKQIASLCSIGELPRASELVKEIVSNLGKN